MIRHAEKTSPREIIVGRTDGIGLSEMGRRQAIWLSRQLSPQPLDMIFSSPLQRARETAQPIADAKQLTLQTDEHFNEIDFGEWTNRSESELRRDERWLRFNAFRIGTRVPSGESMLEVQCRMVGQMLRLRDEHPNAHIAIVGHGDPIRAALLYFCSASLDHWDRFEVSVASVSALTLSEHHARLLYVNRIATNGSN
ncbi:MAG: histidine phosphatase family protein [Nibricoccus sp.]